MYSTLNLVKSIATQRYSFSKMAVELKQRLVDSGCIKFGQFKLKSGLTSDHYVDMRESYRHPQLFAAVVDEICSIIKNTSTEKARAIVGVPWGAVPMAAASADRLHLPYLYLDKGVKEHGRQIGDDHFSNYQSTLIEDVISTGGSIEEVIERVGASNISDIIIAIDRNMGGLKRMRDKFPNIRFHTLINIADVMKNVQSSD